VSAPLTPDEGGFLAIARAWSHGATLYRDVWVDRPQGLLVVFRVWDAVSGGSNASIRVMAMLFAALLVISTAAAVTTIAGRHAGAIAAVLVGVTVSSPVIEGHIANGELLSGAVAMAGLAVGCRALRERCRPGLFVWSGVLAGLALSIKQSGYDGLVTLIVCIVIGATNMRLTRREAIRALLLIAAGVVSVIAPLAIHGALTGFSRWWFAVAGYRLGGRSALTGANWGRLRETAGLAAPVLGPLVIAAIIAGIAARVTPRRHLPLSSGDLLAPMLWSWPLAAVAAFMTGGQFHRHYWLTLCPVLAALTAVALVRALRPSSAAAVALALLLPAVHNSIDLLRLDSLKFAVAASADGRAGPNLSAASWFIDHRRPGDSLYVMCASAAFYADAHEDPPFPYLWLDGVLTVPEALPELRALLASDERAPTYIAIYQSPRICDPSGVVGNLIESRYRILTRVGPVKIFVRLDREAVGDQPAPTAHTESWAAIWRQIRSAAVAGSSP
jgi:hypothetical protein